MSLFCKHFKCNTIMWSCVYIFSSLITCGTTSSLCSQYDGCLQQMAVNNSLFSTFIWGKEQGEEKERLYTSIPCTNIWGFWGCFRGGNQDHYQSTTLKLIVTNQILWTEALSSWCALPKVRRKAPMAWIPNDPTKSLLPKPLNPFYLHIKTCLSVIIAPNCRSGKKPIISRLCFCVCW